jgi:beta-N-acetylhexosaminidase
MKNPNRVAFLPFFLLLIILSPVSAQKPPFYENNGPQKTHWVDSVLQSFSLEEKIGQLFVVAAFSNRDQLHAERTLDLVCNYNIGGLCFFQGGPLRQASLTNYYQAHAKVPLFVSIDGEWGLAMRLDSTIRFPRQMTLGAMRDEMLIYKMAAEIARQCKRIGMQINLAPVIDVNNNPANPVISNRSFGEDKQAVTRKGLLYMKGLQDNNVMANGKHFPGHGDTDIDSHKALPVIAKTRGSIDSLELYPFRELIQQGLQSMMVAHLYIPALDSTPNTASTLSRRVVSDLLKQDLGFQGLVFTDALNMKGVSAFFEPGRVDVKALLAGNDVLLYSEDVPLAIREIKKAIENNEISTEEIDTRVRKILSAKYWAGLNRYKPVDLANLYRDLNTPEAHYLNQQLFEASLTLLRNKDKLIPVRRLDTLRIASLVVGDSAGVPFNKALLNYAPVDFFTVDKNAPAPLLDSLFAKLRPYNMVILSIHNTNVNASRNYGITEQMNTIVDTLRKKARLVVDMFGNPYTLSKLRSVDQADALLMSYEGTELSQSLSAQLLFGGVMAKGRLPVTVSDKFKIGDGLITDEPIRLKYTVPEELGLKSADFARIDSVALRAIRSKAMPGCQVLVAREGKVIYQKSFGYHSYVTSPAVKNTDLYDIASITKIASTTVALMKVQEDKGLLLDRKIGKFLPELKGTNKKDLIFRDVLTHQAGLQSWIPFWKSTVSEGELIPGIFSKQRSDTFPLRVAEEMYMSRSYLDTVWDKIHKSPVSKEKKYVYSDLGFILTRRIVEKEAGISVDSLVRKSFYRPLGLSTMGFRPRERFPLTRIVPTEYDEKFRRQLVHGDVHDPAAAMMGGIEGHAGLFANAGDVAILMQMLLNNGEYGGQKFLKKQTIAEFTRQQFPGTANRRGLGFDKPDARPDKSPASASAGLNSFGHQGFTGTCVWADPDSKLIYVFLSNRVHPSADNDKLVKMSVRTEIQEAVYEAIRNKDEASR